MLDCCRACLWEEFKELFTRIVVGTYALHVRASVRSCSFFFIIFLFSIFFLTTIYFHCVSDRTMM
jgi:hypothetical protein